MWAGRWRRSSGISLLWLTLGTSYHDVWCNGGHYVLLLLQLADRLVAKQNRYSRDIWVEQQEEEQRENEDLEIDRFYAVFEYESDSEPSFIASYYK